MEEHGAEPETRQREGWPGRVTALVLGTIAIIGLLWVILAGTLASARAVAYPRPAIKLQIAPSSLDSLTAIQVGTQVTLTVSVTAGRDLTYVWDFGDGSLQRAGQQVTYRYSSADTYTVTVTATDPIGQQAVVTSSITVASLPPVAAFIWAVDPSSSLRVDFDGTSSTGEKLSFIWHFGDGSAGFGPFVTHLYAVAGKYLVTLAVSDSQSQTDTVTQPVIVRARG
jgi:PKD repeat protein